MLFYIKFFTSLFIWDALPFQLKADINNFIDLLVIRIILIRGKMVNVFI
jgi:hypothetical protein